MDGFALEIWRVLMPPTRVHGIGLSAATIAASNLDTLDVRRHFVWKQTLSFLARAIRNAILKSTSTINESMGNSSFRLWLSVAASRCCDLPSMATSLIWDVGRAGSLPTLFAHHSILCVASDYSADQGHKKLTQSDEHAPTMHACMEPTRTFAWGRGRACTEQAASFRWAVAWNISCCLH